VKYSSQAEDPLTYLQRKPVREFHKGEVIYGSQRAPEGIYVVLSGRVKTVIQSSDGGEIVARIVGPDGLFGESAMVGRTLRSESAEALELVRTMTWSPEEIEHQIEREPRLGLALSQYMVRQCIELQERIESMAAAKTPERVIMALVQLADSLGADQPDGGTRIGALTHSTLAEYVGTSREIVTFQLNRLRRAGMVRYSRRFIDVSMGDLVEAIGGDASGRSRAHFSSATAE
jgi:CRP/FNR family transcriptional regulator, cyclic AMP receptor protein